MNLDVCMCLKLIGFRFFVVIFLMFGLNLGNNFVHVGNFVFVFVFV